ncbi:MAG: response regulator [Eubacteriales bacterium]|nr:response regulator [Eubacteriales bacterium]
MKLLIVDDEALTRQGLISSINWKSLNIQSVYQADDGIHGLDLAKKHRPEIILSDVRMPRMDGIQMAEALAELLPDTAVIFMSGYSDKEYLKAAIKLKAVSYVEKPLDPSEIQEAVLEAASRIEAALLRKQSDSQQKSAKLALLLTQPWRKTERSYEDLLKDFPFPVTEHTYFTSVIVKLQNPQAGPEAVFTDIYRNFRAYLQKYDLSCLFLFKHEQHIVYHLIGNRRPDETTLDKASLWLKDQFSVFGNFFISVGNTVCGIEHAYDSYTSAVILSHSSFFYDYGTILDSLDLALSTPGGLFQDPTAPLQEALSSRNQEETLRILKEVFQYFRTHRDFLPNQVRDIYYQMFLCLQTAFSQAQLSPAADPFRTSGIMTLMEKCDTLSDLHQKLTELSESFFAAAAETLQENSTTFLIKDFISKHYKNPTLSVKDISEHVYLSTSYVCTLFKAETGQTLNQYITEFRMEKAKKLLGDPRYKITDISSRVGYADGNYFGKSFKKIVGLSPSEYREKILK